MRARGLTNRGRKDYPAMPITMHGLTWLLTNKFYTGPVEWQGVEYKGLHESLVDSRTFYKVQDLFASRSGRWSEIRHAHYLKGFLYCAVCGRGLSLQRSKGRYLYFFCLGQKDRRRPTGCKEAYVAAEKLERQVEELYQRFALRLRRVWWVRGRDVGRSCRRPIPPRRVAERLINDGPCSAHLIPLARLAAAHRRESIRRPHLASGLER